MTATEIIVIVCAAALGYWLVAVLLPNMKRDPASNSQPPPFDPSKLAWHQVLGVAEYASREEITAAYKARISQYHPDKVASMAPEFRELAHTRSTEINAAYDQAMQRHRG